MSKVDELKDVLVNMGVIKENAYGVVPNYEFNLGRMKQTEMIVEGLMKHLGLVVEGRRDNVYPMYSVKEKDVK